MIDFEKYRDSCLFYVKLDLALGAAFASAITLFKLDRPDIMDTLSEVYPFLFVVLLLLIYGLSLERMILFRSLFSKIKEANLSRLFHILLILQTFFHTSLFLFIAGYGSGWLDIYGTYRDQENTILRVRKATIEFYEKRSKLPESANKLISGSFMSKTWSTDSSKYLFDYKKIDSVNYIITLPGRDKILGTSDDWTQRVDIVSKEK